MRPSHWPAPRPLLAALLACAPALLAAGPIHDTAFTYQGRLVDNGAAANGAYDLVFRLYDDEFVGVQVASPLAIEDVPVVDGLFTTTLDFGVEDYQFGFWLEMEVRPGDSTDPHVPLAGRVFIQQVPAAMKARLAEQAFDAFTLGGNDASAFAPAAHFHSVLTSPDGSIEVIEVDNSGQARVQIGDAGLNLSRSLSTATDLEIFGNNQGVDQPIATTVGVSAGSNGTGTPGHGGDLYLRGGFSNSGDGGIVALGGGLSFGDGNGGYVLVSGGEAVDGVGGSVGLLAGTSVTSAGGEIGIFGGEGSPGGVVEVRGGSGKPVSDDAAGGDIRLFGGQGGGSTAGDGGPGGDIHIRGGLGAGDLDNPGGDVRIEGGLSSLGSSKGTVFIDSPAQFASTVGLFNGDLTMSGDASSFSLSRNGGGALDIALGPGTSSSSGDTTLTSSGRFNIHASESTVGNQIGSGVLLRGGSVLAGGNAAGGGVALLGGDGASAGFTNEPGGPGGNIVLVGGRGRGVGQNAGGSVVLAGGDSSDGNPARDGFVDIQSRVSILRPIQRPQPGAVLQVGGLVPEDGNGAYLSSDGVWTNTSDANKKTVVGDVDPREVLARVLALPLKNWRHRGATNAPLHMGPMAQDFFAAFGLGDSERHIGSVDADGVALAAIQGLHAEANERLQALENENHLLRERLARLEALLIANQEAQP